MAATLQNGQCTPVAARMAGIDLLPLSARSCAEESGFVDAVPVLGDLPSQGRADANGHVRDLQNSRTSCIAIKRAHSLHTS